MRVFVTKNSTVLDLSDASLLTGFLNFRSTFICSSPAPVYLKSGSCNFGLPVPSIWSDRKRYPGSQCLLGTCSPYRSCRLIYTSFVYLKCADILPLLSSWLWCCLFSTYSGWVDKQFLWAPSFCRSYIWHFCDDIYLPGGYLCYNDSNSYLFRCS